MDMEEIIKAWAGDHVIVRHDSEARSWVFIAVHSTKLGPPTGGTRIKSYRDHGAALQDALRLAEGMTYKWAVLRIARGGGKAVIDVPEDLDATMREGLLRRYARLIDRLGGGFETGPDMGTGPAEMDILAEETTHVFGKSTKNGGAGDPGPYTALGVLSGIRALCGQTFGTDDLSKRRVFVQGAGHVGEPLIRHLLREGAKVVFCDTDEQRVGMFEHLGCQSVEPERAYEQEVDVFAPCAMGGILTPSTINRLRCRIVAGSANNQLGEPGDADLLRERGIVYAPDFIINAGGAIFLPAREGAGLSLAAIEEQILKIGETLLEVLERSEKEEISTARAAQSLAETNLEST
jgi:leucine dehydrogenase